jgi:tetratricopeptide (TPR) repeat protein
MRIHCIVLSAGLTLLCSLFQPSHGQSNQAQETYRLTVEASQLIRDGRQSEAQAKLSEVLKLNPNSWDATYYMGFSYEQIGDLQKALIWYQKAEPLDQNRHEAVLGVARIYYKLKDYKNAIPIMERLSEKHPATEKTYAGYLALARSYAETGKIKEFCDTVDKAFAVKSNDPNGWRFAGQEMDYLKHYKEAVKYYKEYLKRFPNQPDAPQISKRLEIVNYEGKQDEELKEVQEGFSLDGDHEDLRTFILFVDPNRANVSDKAVAQLLLGLSEIPRHYRNQLESAGYKVVVAPSVLDVLPQLAGQTPRGYAQGSTWHNSNGTFDRDTRQIVIAEKYNAVDRGGQLTEGPLDETVQHEFGHAMDFHLGVCKLGRTQQNPYPEISHSPWFTEAYNYDSQNVPFQLRSKLAYYLQPGDGGKEELFAQMFPLFFGHEPSPGSALESFKQAFPTVLARMADARKFDPDYERFKSFYDSKLKDNTLAPNERVQQLLSQ